MSRERGKIFEDQACKYLKKKAFKILDRNVNYPFGEIDIVARKKEILIFVEVKGGNPSFLPRTRVTLSKMKKIEKAANRYISDSDFDFEECRLDVIEVLNDGTINHLEGIGRW